MANGNIFLPVPQMFRILMTSQKEPAQHGKEGRYEE